MEFELEIADEKTTEWTNFWQGLDEAPFTMTVNKATWNEEKSVFYLFDETDEEKTVATSVYATNHPSAKHKNTPHGVRFARAALRTFTDIERNSDAIVAHINELEDGCTVTVTKTDKGILWEVA